MRTILPFLAVLCASCAGERVVEYRVVAIGSEETELPCVVFRDDEVVLDKKSNEPVVTPATVKVTFKEKDDGSGGYAGVKLGVKAVTLDPQGKIQSGAKDEEPSPYLEDSRYLYWQDSRAQLFVLRRNKDYVGP